MQSTNEVKSMLKTSITLSRKSLYVNPTAGTVKVGSKDKAHPAGLLFGSMARGAARRLRKSLRREGFGSVAGQRRIMIID